MKIVEFTGGGVSPFGRWFSALNAPAAVKVSAALYRLEQSHRANIKSLGGGLFEYKVDFGPGYRIYFIREGSKLIILLGGGSKKRQEKDIKLARKRRGVYLAEKRKK